MLDTDGLTFFFIDEAATVDALVGRIVPGTPDDPGAREAGVLTYIDRALAGAYTAYQQPYRQGIRALNAYTRRSHDVVFHELPESEQDAVIAALERDEVPGFGEGGAHAFFVMLWSHTLEGMFSDPAYGGNRDGIGWKLIGFPGGQYGYGAEEMRYGADLSTKPLMTLAGMRRLASERPDLFFRRPGPEPEAEVPPEPAAPERVRDVTTTEG